MDLVEFLTARLDEDEHAARAATPGPWAVDDESYAEAVRAEDVAVVAGGRWGGEASVFESTADALHIARHDPARVLAEVDAKRQLLAWVLRWPMRPHPPSSVDGVLELLALPYADHPDYDEAWRP